MKSRLHPFVPFLAAIIVLTHLRAQEDPLKDPDLQEALKQASELEKQNGPAKPVKMSDLKKQADEIQADQKQEDQKEKAALQDQLEKQLAAPGPSVLPDWTPPTPQLQATGSVTKKIVDDEVRVIQTGTSPRTPQEILDAWEAAVADKPLNHFHNNTRSNGNAHARLDVSTRNNPVQKVRLEASRDSGEKITRVTIALRLPKPGEDNE
jgi:hypothetical protein